MITKKQAHILDRIEAFKYFEELKDSGLLTKEIADEIAIHHPISQGTVYDWSYGSSPYGKIRLKYCPELFYVLGALLGDGCAYHWKREDRRIINLIGDNAFASKYAEKLAVCTHKKKKAYINRSNGCWFVNISNIELFLLFTKYRCDMKSIHELLKKGEYKEKSLAFIEGFFDAEGCVKIVKGKERKTPKVCLDFCNTNFEYLELIRELLKLHLGIEAKYSVQKQDLKLRKKTCYHLRIYKKEWVKLYLDNIHAIKFTEEKIKYAENWFKI